MACLITNPPGLCAKPSTSWLFRYVQGKVFHCLTQGWQVTEAEVRVDTRGRCWTVLTEPGNLSYRSSSSGLESRAGSSPMLSDFRFLEVAGSPGLGGGGGGGQKDMPTAVRTFQKCVWGSSGLYTAPSWGAGWSEPCVALEDLGLPPGDRGILHIVCLEEQGELRKKGRSCSMARLRTLLSEQPQARSRLGFC